jgi:hypothetical protein
MFDLHTPSFQNYPQYNEILFRKLMFIHWDYIKLRRQIIPFIASIILIRVINSLNHWIILTRVILRYLENLPQYNLASSNVWNKIKKTMCPLRIENILHTPNHSILLSESMVWLLHLWKSEVRPLGPYKMV